MAWTTPASWTTSEVVTAAKMTTHVKDNLSYLKGATGTVAFDGLLTSISSVAPGNGTTIGPAHWGGSGAPSAGLGANGDYYFRSDTPGTANQRIYVKSAGAWTGIV